MGIVGMMVAVGTGGATVGKGVDDGASVGRGVTVWVGSGVGVVVGVGEGVAVAGTLVGLGREVGTVGAGTGVAVGEGVGEGVAVAGTLVGLGREVGTVGTGMGLAVGDGVGTGVAVGDGVGTGMTVGDGIGAGLAVAGTLVAAKLGVGKGAVGVDDGSGARVAVEVTAGAMVWLPLKESESVQVTASAPKIAASSHGCFESLGRLKDFIVSLAWLALSRTKWIRASG